MDWIELMSGSRLGKTKGGPKDNRSPYQRDFDRIVFSSAFRRLQDKTQVFPLPTSDYVRTRLTHSLEVSCVGRSLGEMVGREVLSTNRSLAAQCTKEDFAAVVASACLAHDIGNPPFGHSGEASIQSWFAAAQSDMHLTPTMSEMQPRETEDLSRFEGNAQGFRILARLQNSNNPGGLQLTMATLAAFAKYPRESRLPEEPELRQGQSGKKFGFFQSENELFEEVATTVGLIRRDAKVRAWARHPLAFLVEAADDICYRIIDFEDGFRLGLVPYREAEELLGVLVGAPVMDNVASIRSEKDKIEYLRARAIGSLIPDVVEVFMENEKAMLKGSFDADLIGLLAKKEALDAIRAYSKKKVYATRDVVRIEAAGFEVLGGLLQAFVPAAYDVSKHRIGASPRSKKYLQLLPPFAQAKIEEGQTSAYERALAITDTVSGMTDSYAVAVFKMLKGISLPDQ